MSAYAVKYIVLLRIFSKNDYDKIKFSCNRIQKDGNNADYKSFFNEHNDVVTDKAFIFVNGKGLSHV